MVYADSSALVKTVVQESETSALNAFFQATLHRLVTSKLAIIEVTRACRLAGSSPERDTAVKALFESCELVEISDGIVMHAAALVTAELRSLDAIHLATALEVRASEMLVYDRRLAAAAAAAGLVASNPGA